LKGLIGRDRGRWIGVCRMHPTCHGGPSAAGGPAGSPFRPNGQHAVIAFPHQRVSGGRSLNRKRLSWSAKRGPQGAVLPGQGASLRQLAPGRTPSRFARARHPIQGITGAFWLAPEKADNLTPAVPAAALLEQHPSGVERGPI